MEPSSSVPLGSVLIIGGCGFVGFHVVQHFLREPSCTSVSVISRNPNINILPGVSYYAASITDLPTLSALIQKIRPTVVIHAACPSPTSGNAKTYEDVTVRGTQKLLTAAAECPCVRALIYTSSATMAAGHQHVDLDESAPLADTDPSSHPYAATKARADRLVLAANQPTTAERESLRTACIRLPIVYGERDLLAIPGALAALQKGQTRFQLGPGTNLWDFCSADNAAAAHVLLAQALLVPGRPSTAKVDGEAFNITDGTRRSFWAFPRDVWRAAGHEVDPEKVWEMPIWLAMFTAELLEWLYRIFTWGAKRPAQMGRQQVEYSCFEHTYSIEKARTRLGYMPKDEWDEGIKTATQWSLRSDGWAAKLKT
ncbi:hypothetical protein MMC18_007687 [Xylographa bjoerkii]|nr:hypothetical protein [Xylographa bjoerkii]